MDLGKAINYTITIEPSANKGFIVSVGCAKFVFANSEDLVNALSEYLFSPDKLQDEYNKIVQSDCPEPVLRATAIGGEKARP